MRITLAQLEPTLGDIAGNLERAREVIERARAEGADLVVFPELFVTGYSIGEIDVDLSMSAEDPRLLDVVRGAGDTGVVIGFSEDAKRSPHTYNSTAFYAGGQLAHVHRKLYLPAYRPFEERNHFTPGPTLRAFPGPADTRLAVLLCNDAWQPHLAFLAVHDGAQVLIVPAASAQSMFPERYDSHEYWHDITRFYGRMFQVFVVFVNRVGTEGQFRFWGGSHVVDPWGNTVAEAAQDQEQELTVTIDLADVRRRRREVPLVKEARLGLLQREAARLLDEGGDL
ncbi:nitrilase-related carbon-nitrogen hydrolase [Nocardioides sp. InS609-2]|uniref:nitrilase-related carbon-nitrogen hydrolase n=1 Tax=Nocardioides sp. InS609-2 TaxID=2760705 RepID=UPI0020BE8E99|nr:nitrilase-related carbon-nitrogen hydrolase [Nocardioides sp. InS609-2]